MDVELASREIKNVFMINQKAGQGQVKAFLQYLYQLPLEQKKECCCVFPINSEDMINLTKLYSHRYPRAVVYSVGGDGTLNNVVNGISASSPLAIIPLGTGNDFYRLYKKIKGTKKIDLGIVNQRKFINIASIGIDAVIAREANELKNKKIFQKNAYLFSILENIFQNESYPTNLGELTLLAVANGKDYGSGVPINPYYVLDDGLFDVYQTSKLTRLQILKLFIKVFQGSHVDDKLVKFYQTDKLDITSSIPLVGNVDGEIFYDKTFHFEIIPSGITVTTEVPDFIRDYMKVRKK